MNMNSGYVGWSMSKRAAEAYDSGLAPLSRIGGGKYVRAAAQLVGPAEWHHTSKYCNRTDFYEVERVRRVAASLRRQRRDAKAIEALRRERMMRQMPATTLAIRPSAYWRSEMGYIRRLEAEAADAWLEAEKAAGALTRSYWLDVAARDWAVAASFREALRAKIAARFK